MFRDGSEVANDPHSGRYHNWLAELDLGKNTYQNHHYKPEDGYCSAWLSMRHKLAHNDLSHRIGAMNRNARIELTLEIPKASQE
jgi:hypothetical protein